jgi:hypothetical protein
MERGMNAGVRDRRSSRSRLCILAALLSISFVAAFPAPDKGSSQSKPDRWPSPVKDVVGDYDSELRLANGRADIATLVARLKDLGVTSYYWLLWHASTDWEDLKLFLPRAAEAGIAVTAYLVPPSESPPHAQWYSEPFRLDYKRWGEELARLSLAHPNLTSWVIDDFYANHELFTPAYVRDMQARAKKVNPNLVFMPLMYYGEITAQFVEDYRRVIDGVVAAYPRGREEISRARAVLNGRDSSGGGSFHIPFIVMSAGVEYEFRLRYGDPATPERIADWLRMCLKAWRDGLCDGVVTYCLDKSPESKSFPLAKKLFKEFGRS